MPAQPLSVYIHIPFCTLKCSYCDFNSYANLEQLIPPFTEALCDEMHLWSPVARNRPVETVFFGGGTPSLMPLSDLQQIMSTLREAFNIARDAEVSIEANPGTVDRAYIEGLLECGVNRLSFGVQSFHDDELAALDRIHNADDARQGYHWAREAGFERINLDLIYGLPEQPLDRWRLSLEQALELGPDHLSLYALTVEEGTKLAYDIEHGHAPEPDGDQQAEMYELSQRLLASAGYGQYEISNWCRPGEECRHNLVYWRNGDWLAFGPGAHGHLSCDAESAVSQPEDPVIGYRFAGVYSPRRYVELVREPSHRGIDPQAPLGDLLRSMKQVTFIDPQPASLEMADTAILALRLNRGLNTTAFERRFGHSPEQVFGPTLAEMTAAGMLERADGHIRLTHRGRYLANEVFISLLPD